MTSKGIIGLLAATAWLFAGGCNGSSQSTSNPPARAEMGSELVAQVKPPIPDLPVPVSFSLNEDESRSIASAGMRFVEHVYVGKPDKYAVKRFYMARMPENRWVLINDVIASGEVRLEFEKDGRGERCTLIIGENSGIGSVFSPTRIKATVQTVGRVETPAGPR